MFLVLCLQASLVEAFTPIIAFSCAVFAHHCVSCALFAGVSGGGLHAHHCLFPVLCLPNIVFLVLCLQASLVEAFTPIIAFSCTVFAHHCVSCALFAGVSGGGLHAYHCLFPVLCLLIIVFLVLCLQASLVEAFTPIIAFSKAKSMLQGWQVRGVVA